MESMRAGFGSRFGAFFLDCCFVVLISIAAVTVAIFAGGIRLAMEVQSSFGVSLNIRSVASGDAWQELAQKAEAIGQSLQAQWERDFTSEQIDFIGSKLGQQFDAYFGSSATWNREHFDLFRVLTLNGSTISRMVQNGFDAVRTSGRTDIDPARLQAAETQMMALLDQFHVDRIVPMAVSFVLVLLTLPLIVATVYVFLEAVSGNSPGKAIGHIRIVAADGERAGMGMLVSRFFVKNLWLLMFIAALAFRAPALMIVGSIALVILIGGAFATLGPQRRALHDYIAGTAICYR